MLTRKRDEAVVHDADAVEKNTSAGSTALCASSYTVPM